MRSYWIEDYLHSTKSQFWTFGEYLIERIRHGLKSCSFRNDVSLKNILLECIEKEKINWCLEECRETAGRCWLKSLFSPKRELYQRGEMKLQKTLRNLQKGYKGANWLYLCSASLSSPIKQSLFLTSPLPSHVAVCPAGIEFKGKLRNSFL